MWHCRFKRSRLFMSEILRLKHINLPSQPRMPRETSAETKGDPGSSTYPAAAESCSTDHGALEMQTAWPYFWEPRIRWLCSYIQRKTGKIWRWTSASVALKSLPMCAIVKCFTKQQHNTAVHIWFHQGKVSLSAWLLIVLLFYCDSKATDVQCNGLSSGPSAVWLRGWTINLHKGKRR